MNPTPRSYPEFWEMNDSTYFPNSTNKKIAPAGKRFLKIVNVALSSLSYAGISARCVKSRIERLS